ncbi:DUF6220 domain-containing protein [Glycomyces tarimensis]
MLKFYRVWTAFLGLLIALQFFLAGYGAIGTGDPTESFELHIMNGRLIGVVTLLGILFAALARAGGKLVGLAAAAFGLVLLQSVIALISVTGTVPGQIIFGFHAINALVIMTMVELSGREAKRVLRSRTETEEPVAPEAAPAR